MNMMDSLARFVYSQLVDEEILGVAFEIHRQAKTGLDQVINGILIDHTIKPGEPISLDVTKNKKQLECVCPNCSRSLAASRFAPHLEKCIGMGRNSSRIATRRIASSVAQNNAPTAHSDDDDDDWTEKADRKRKKRDKYSPRRPRKRNNGDGGSGSSGSIPSSPAGTTTPPEYQHHVRMPVVTDRHGRVSGRSGGHRSSYVRRNITTTLEDELIDVDSL